MTRSRWAALAALTHLAAFVGGYVIARRNVPARVEERVATKEVVKWRERIVKVESTNQQASARENVKVVANAAGRLQGSGAKPGEAVHCGNCCHVGCLEHDGAGWVVKGPF
jgi:hypothetical protein